MPKLSKKIVETLKPVPGKDFTVWDSKVKGFGVRVRGGGTKTYIFQYRNNNQVLRKIKIGTHGNIAADQAREEAQKLAAKITLGEDPAAGKSKKAEQTADMILVTDLAKRYLEIHAKPNKTPRSYREDYDIVHNYIIPKFGSIQVQALKLQELESWRITMKDKPSRANRVLKVISKMYSLAIQWEYCTLNPVRGVTLYRENKRDRWLQDEELNRLWEVLSRYAGYAPANALKMLLFTGSRKGEVLNATWEQFNLERGVWIKPFHLTKQKKTEYVPLSQETLVFLTDLKENATSSHLFPGKAPNRPLVSIKKFWAKILKEANIENIRIHDLRHTYASHLVSSGLSLSIVGKLLGHTQAATTQRYAHLADQALRDATNVFGNKIANLKKNGTSSQES